MKFFLGFVVGACVAGLIAVFHWTIATQPYTDLLYHGRRMNATHVILIGQSDEVEICSKSGHAGQTTIKFRKKDRMDDFVNSLEEVIWHPIWNRKGN